MRQTTLPIPELGLIAATRGMLGAGAALLLADKLPTDKKKTVGWTLFLVGAASTIPLVMDDTKALLDFAASQPAASKGPIGTVGYCMSGQYAINAATHFPDRVKAAASIYGAALTPAQYSHASVAGPTRLRSNPHTPTSISSSLRPATAPQLALDVVRRKESPATT